MDPQQPQQSQTQIQTQQLQLQLQETADHQQDGGISGKAAAAAASGNYLCRQSSTRWTPTTDQIKILKDLYYNSGVRSPTADQIQKISARLRQFGKIEGKNVFYWFQNHKARERQKKRFTAANTTEIQRPSNIIYPNFTSGISCPSSASGMVGDCGYGHMSMESGLRECGMPACGNGGICSYPTQGFQWTSVNPYPQSYSFMESTRNQCFDHEDQFPEEDGGKAPGLETLPLFPVHAGSEPAENYYTTSCHWFNAADTVSSGRASLELRLNSYGDQCPNY